MIENIYLYYTNDLHSYFDHWSRVATFLKNEKEKCKAKNDTYFLFDIGDHIDRVHPITEATMGKANIELLNELDYDLVTIGNNEGITLSHQQLYHLYDDASFSVVCSNLQCMNKPNPSWLKTSKIIHSEQGVSIGVIGLTAPFNPYYHLLHWHVKAPFETLQKELEKLHGKVDIIILLSHLGIYEDEKIAKHFSEIDVIIGGHTHHLLRTGERIGNSVITAAGKHCAHVGQVMLSWDHRVKKLVTKEAYVTDITHLPRDLQTEQRLKELEDEANVILDKTIVYTQEPLKVHWFQETKLMNKFTEKLLQWTNSDIAMLNAGLLLDELSAGKITYKDVHRICPHPINPCVVSLTGKEIIEVVRASMTKQFMELKLKGFGFRGEVIGKMIFVGLEVELGHHANGHQYVQKVLYNGNPIVGDDVYEVATADLFTFGRLLPEVAKSETQKLFLPEFIRYLLVLTLLDYSKWK